MKQQISFQRTAAAVLVLFFLAFLPGCAALDSFFSFLGFSDGSGDPNTPESMVMAAMTDFNRGRYASALKKFDEIKDRFPFTQHSLLAELKSADCNYYEGNYVEAVAQYEEFASSHPTNEALPYVFFQIAMGYYKQIDTIDRDPGAAMDAINAFTKLLKTYPDSPYTEEARARRLAARNFLAKHEMYVAMFYVRTDELDQAVGRLEYLLDNYPETESARDAADILARIKAGNPPRRTWRDWIPDLGMPDWQTFKDIAPGGGSAGGM